MNITYRPYQKTAIKQGLYFFDSNRIQKPKMMVEPTAAGKSIIIAGIASELPHKTLVLQPSKELLIQNYNKYLLYDTNCAAYSASVNRRDIAHVTFATIGTIVSVPHLFKEFKYLIIDEAHLYPPKIDSQFKKFLAENPQLKILGFTATPFRLQSSSGGSKLSMMHYSNIYNGYQHITQIQEVAPNYWAKIKYIEALESNAKLVVNSTGADYTDKSLALFGKSVNKQIRDIVGKHYDEQTLFFVPSVEEAERLAKLYPGSAAVHGKTPDKERAKIVAAIKAEEINRVFNVGVFSVGADFPTIRNLVDAMPTLSLAKHYQRYGRLTRLHPLGHDVQKVYYDLSGNTKRFGRIEDLELRPMGSTFHMFNGNKKLTGEKMVPENGPYVPRASGVFIDMEIPFGSHKGKKLTEAPRYWLGWACDNIQHPELLRNIKLLIEIQRQTP